MNKLTLIFALILSGSVFAGDLPLKTGSNLPKVMSATLPSATDINTEEKVAQYTNAVVTVKTDSKFTYIKVQKDLFNEVSVYEVVHNKPGERKYVFTGPPGKYKVNIISFDGTSGAISEQNKIVIIEGAVPPIVGPVDPKPDPVKPNVDPSPVIPPLPQPDNQVADKWGIVSKVNQFVAEIPDTAAKAKAPELAVAYLTIAAKLKSGEIKSAQDAFGQLSVQASSIITVPAHKTAWSSFNIKLSQELSKSWPTMQPNEVSTWLELVGIALKGNLPPPQPPVVNVLGSGFKVMFVKESKDAPTYTASQLTILSSTKIVAYLKEKCVKGPNGSPEYRYLDKDKINDPNLPAHWKAAMQINREGLPYMIMSDGTRLTVKKITPEDTEDSILALLKTYGG